MSFSIEDLFSASRKDEEEEILNLILITTKDKSSDIAEFNTNYKCPFGEIFDYLLK